MKLEAEFNIDGIFEALLKRLDVDVALCIDRTITGYIYNNPFLNSPFQLEQIQSKVLANLNFFKSEAAQKEVRELLIGRIQERFTELAKRYATYAQYGHNGLGGYQQMPSYMPAYGMPGGFQPQPFMMPPPARFVQPSGVMNVNTEENQKSRWVRPHFLDVNAPRQLQPGEGFVMAVLAESIHGSDGENFTGEAKMDISFLPGVFAIDGLEDVFANPLQVPVQIKDGALQVNVTMHVKDDAMLLMGTPGANQIGINRLILQEGDETKEVMTAGIYAPYICPMPTNPGNNAFDRRY